MFHFVIMEPTRFWKIKGVELMDPDASFMKYMNGFKGELRACFSEMIRITALLLKVSYNYPTLSLSISGQTRAQSSVLMLACAP